MKTYQIKSVHPIRILPSHPETPPSSTHVLLSPAKKGISVVHLNESGFVPVDEIQFNWIYSAREVAHRESRRGFDSFQTFNATHCPVHPLLNEISCHTGYDVGVSYSLQHYLAYFDMLEFIGIHCASDVRLEDTPGCSLLCFQVVVEGLSRFVAKELTRGVVIIAFSPGVIHIAQIMLWQFY
ncbi:hypothetical protein AKJ16_DCAP20028 [Drosera capensis]